MRCRPRILAAFAAVAVLGYASSASAALWTTVGAPPSSMSLTIRYLTTQTAGSTGALGVDSNGNQDIDLTLDGNGDGTLQFNNDQFTIEQILDVPLDFSFLGTADLALGYDNDGSGQPGASNPVGINVNSSAITVDGNVWDIDATPPTTFDVSLNAGNILVYNATGTVMTLLGTTAFGYDLTNDPQTVGIGDLSGFGLGGTATELQISFIIPQIELLLDADFGIYADLSGTINLVPIPEPSTIAMLGIGLVGLVATGYRRFRKNG